MRDAGSLVFLGNCQAAALRVAWNRSIAEPDQPAATSIDGRFIGEADRRTLAAADTIVAQVADMNSADVDDLSGLRARIVLFPYLSGFFYWPFSTDRHLQFGMSGLTALGLYSQEFGGDAFLNRLLREGTSAAAAVEIYRALDFERACSISRRFDLIMRTQRARDQRSGIETAGYLERNLAKGDLFAARGHPTAEPFLHLAVQVFERLGASPQALSRLECNTVRSPIHMDEVPIHPALLRRFGDAAANPDRRYHFGPTTVTFDEYVVNYMTCRYDQDEQEGLLAARSGRDGDVIAKLLPALPARRLSYQALMALGGSLGRAGRHDDAVAVYEQGVELYPSDHVLRLTLARYQLVWRTPEEAEATLQPALSLHPENADANALLSKVLEKQGRYAEALRCLRRAHGRAGPGPEAAALSLRYAWLSLRVGNLPAARSASRDAQRGGADAQALARVFADIESMSS